MELWEKIRPAISCILIVNTCIFTQYSPHDGTAVLTSRCHLCALGTTWLWLICFQD